MPYHYILGNLLSRNEGAVGVLFVDDSGETVDLACADFSPYQMRVVGAYVGIYLRQMHEFLAEHGHGEPTWLHIYLAPLPDGYYLVLVQRAPGLSALARRSLAEACDRLTEELFTT